MIPNSAVFDTNILIEYSKDIDGSVRAVEKCTERFVSIITWIEFLAGFSAGDQEKARLFLKANFHVIPLDNSICEHAIMFRHQRRFKLPDAIIYATALSCGVRLVTRNVKDFDAGDPVIYIPYS